ncbi:hypothetical protein D5S18_27130 [Nocardia panacis]|uniref:Uncharacterized protein n=1 Tax=Nocardia panacis TaxID=2340916 RepID=A0A3A4KEH8_9NOCA|nr:hypothetical protein [Nocardia panacis]RJO70859.1 hypothetical protein D5S18_27130 [Nocardia panacis]
MPGFVVDYSTKMLCPHGGQVTFVPGGAPVAVIGVSPVATAVDQLVVIGCGLTGSAPPCTMVQWSNLGTPLFGGAPVLLQSTPPPGPGNGICLGSLTPGPPQLSFVQVRVVGT